MADVERQSERVFGDVGLFAVTADTSVCKSFLRKNVSLCRTIKKFEDRTYRVTFVDLSISLTSLLTDHGACLLLVHAPHTCIAVRRVCPRHGECLLTALSDGHTLRVDHIVGIDKGDS